MMVKIWLILSSYAVYLVSASVVEGGLLLIYG